VRKLCRYVGLRWEARGRRNRVGQKRREGREERGGGRRKSVDSGRAELWGEGGENDNR